MDTAESGATPILVSPWESKPEGEQPAGQVADLEGVYLDPSVHVVQAADIYQGYLGYQRTGGLWNLQTNVPWQLYHYALSLYDGHMRVTPALVYYLQLRRINNDKANIINMDYLGDLVVDVDGSHDLVSAVIAANVAPR